MFLDDHIVEYSVLFDNSIPLFNMFSCIFFIADFLYYLFLFMAVSMFFAVILNHLSYFKHSLCDTCLWPSLTE